MKILGIKEVFNDYKKISLLVAVRDCDYKCCIEGGFDISICQNHTLDNELEIEINTETLSNKILSNNLIEAVIFGGKECMLDKYFTDMVDVINSIRKKSDMDVVIYTGYTEEEIKDKTNILKLFSNIIIKLGRFIPNSEPIYDELLGIKLISNNQYAIKIS